MKTRYITLPLHFEYDAEILSTGPATCQAAIYDADGRLIVEEPGPDVSWQALEELVNIVNSTIPRKEEA